MLIAVSNLNSFDSTFAFRPKTHNSFFTLVDSVSLIKLSLLLLSPSITVLALSILMSKKGKKTSPYSLQSEQAKIGASDITLGLEKFGNERDAQHLFLEGSINLL